MMTARDRDRLRPEALALRGWRFHRIWSTAFYRDPQGETAKVVAAWHEAKAAAASSPVGVDGTPAGTAPSALPLVDLTTDRNAPSSP